MTETADTSSKRVRWLGIALGVSLALNLLIAGHVIGRVFHGPHMFGGPHPGFHQLAKDLSPEGQEIVRTVVRDKMGPLRDDVRQMREVRNRIHALMTADEVDIDALNGAFDELRQHSDAMHRAIQAATIEVARRLPPEERRNLKFGWGPRRHHDRYHGDGMPPPPAPPPGS